VHFLIIFCIGLFSSLPCSRFEILFAQIEKEDAKHHHNKWLAKEKREREICGCP
jgi:hypothetical protein